MPSLLSSLLLAALPLLASAAPHPAWALPGDSPYHSLFRRQSAVPPVGSDAWIALYPQASGTPTTFPQSWTDALNAAISQGLIPNISVSNLNGGYPTYSDGQGTDPDICSFTYVCNATTDLTNPPDGIVALAFDDGPTSYSDQLYDFLASNHQHATHFMIGSNILWNSAQFIHAFNTNEDHIAVHTWSHPYMTTLTNEQVVSELGWTVQIIHDSTGGLLPAFWRPPFGDVDNRVRAIAQHIFGLKTVTWNQDSADWSISTGYTTLPAVEGALNMWATGPKSPGLEILEHELTNITIAAFMSVYPTMISSGWKVQPVPDAYGFPWYANADNSTSPLQYTAGVASPQQSLSTAGSTSSASSSPSSTGSGAGDTVTASASASGSKSSPSSGSGSAAKSAGEMRIASSWASAWAVGALALGLLTFA
ncbi:glycoside hydrolase/deacetylase [Dacryopinax primogenitus]|uniref:chitin deacetylase n=1 Tax=Dacryopinax primogenitus (strain DJM 731) TaxID=1858805 RepID=M5FSB9_DACPD|nr:glycoside hydrolase/deacetylase [Dacryopinax primogenitus]EJT98708.1 glycoside hydrolase/deacetylase [Dacryopinax primogenitus]